MTFELEIVTSIGAPIEVVFDLSLDVDVHLAAMAGSGERAIAGVTSGQIGLARRSPGAVGTSVSPSR